MPRKPLLNPKAEGREMSAFSGIEVRADSGRPEPGELAGDRLALAVLRCGPGDFVEQMEQSAEHVGVGSAVPAGLTHGEFQEVAEGRTVQRHSDGAGLVAEQPRFKVPRG